MQENNFEKSVRQKLDELQLTPPEPVWQKVEAAIRKRRERRLVFWLLPILLLSGGLAWWQMTLKSSMNSLQQATRKVAPQTQPTFSKPHTVQPVQIIHNAKPSTTTRKAKENRSTQTGRQLNKIALAKKSELINFNKTNKQQVAQKSIGMLVSPKKQNSRNSNAVADNKPPFNSTPTANAHIETMVNSSSPPKAHDEKQQSESEAKSISALKLDTVQKDTAAKKDTIEKVVQQPSKIVNTKRSLHWQMIGRIGTSNVVEPLLNGFGAKAYESTYPAADYSGGVSNGRSSPPSMPSKGLYFSLGAMLKKPIGRSSFVVTGLQYSFYRNHLSIGTEVPADSVNTFPTPQNLNLFILDARKIFRNNGTQTQHNQFANTYQFIELPFGFEYPLWKKVPLHIQHGFLLSHLFSSNALEYDYASNAYYLRSAGLRKTSLAFFTTVDYTLWSGKKCSLQAGPHIQYSLQSIFKNTSNDHLLSGGVAVSMGF